MRVECIISEDVVLVLSGENAIEEEILKALVKQNNHLVEVRSSINIISKTIRGSVLICRKESFSEMLPEENKEEIKEPSKK